MCVKFTVVSGVGARFLWFNLFKLVADKQTCRHFFLLTNLLFSSALMQAGRQADLVLSSFLLSSFLASLTSSIWPPACLSFLVHGPIWTFHHPNFLLMSGLGTSLCNLRSMEVLKQRYYYYRTGNSCWNLTREPNAPKYVVFESRMQKL